MNALSTKHRWFFTERAKQVQSRQDNQLYKDGSDAGVLPEEIDRSMATNFSNELAAKASEVAAQTEGLSDQDFAKVVPGIAQEMMGQMPDLQTPNASQLALAGITAALTPEHGFDAAAAPYQYGLQKQAQDYQIQERNAAIQREADANLAKAAADERKMAWEQTKLEMQLSSRESEGEANRQTREEIANLRTSSAESIASVRAALAQQGIDLQKIGLELRERDVARKEKETDAKIANWDVDQKLKQDYFTLAKEKFAHLKDVDREQLAQAAERIAVAWRNSEIARQALNIADFNAATNRYQAELRKFEELAKTYKLGQEALQMLGPFIGGMLKDQAPPMPQIPNAGYGPLKIRPFATGPIGPLPKPAHKQKSVKNAIGTTKVPSTTQPKKKKAKPIWTPIG